MAAAIDVPQDGRRTDTWDRAQKGRDYIGRLARLYTGFSTESVDKFDLEFCPGHSTRR